MVVRKGTVGEHQGYACPGYEAKAERVVSRLRKLLPETCSLLHESLEDTLTLNSFTGNNWCHIRSINHLERLSCEVRRRSWMVRVFLNFASCLVLAAARQKWPRRNAEKRNTNWTQIFCSRTSYRNRRR
ncbi:MAG: hypothetical protein HPY71_14620 [Firmicutes bacterium]|nr:hypothetical protein [Bacillota bacterium]